MNRRSLVFVCLALPALSQAQTMLRLNLQPRTYTYVMNMDMDQAMMGKVNQKMTTTIAVKKSGANYVMTQKITSMKVTADKGSPMAGQAAQLEKAAKGSTTTATYNNRGRLIGNIKSVGSAQATNMLQGMQIGFMGLEFPATAVRPGSSWTASMDLAKMMKSMGGGQVPANVKISGTPLTIKYTVKSLGTNNGKRIANISYTINGTLNMQMPGGQGGMNKMTMKMGGTGSSVVDVATGLQTSSKSNMSIAMAPMNMTMKMNVTMNLK